MSRMRGENGGGGRSRAANARCVRAHTRQLPRHHSGRRRWGTATLLVLDRSVDAAVTLLHDFTYQSMVYDLLELTTHGERHDLYKYSFKSTKGVTAQKDVLLSEADDKVWHELRHDHIADAIKSVISQLNAFLSHNKAANFDKTQVKTIKDMSDALAAMPEYRETLAKFEVGRASLFAFVGVG